MKRHVVLVPMVVVVLLLSVAFFVPPVFAAGTILVDESQTNGITRGEVLVDNPGAGRIAVYNNFHFWTAIREIPAADGSLEPTDPRVDLGGSGLLNTSCPPRVMRPGT